MKKNHVHYQGIGDKPAKQIKDFKVGEKLLFNFGYTCTILDKEVTKSGKSVNIVLKDDQTKKVHTRRFQNETLWGIGK